MTRKQEYTDREILKALSEAGLPQFKLDRYGFPLSGQVIKYYREQMKYIDPETGKEKHWTQADLARRLGVTELMVRLMETKDKGLDSVERRRVLAALLKIPPALLGLSSLGELIESITAPHSSSGRHGNTNRRTHDGDSILLYKNALTAYNNLHIRGASSGIVRDIETCIGQLRQSIKMSASKREQRELLYLLWEFYRLVNDIYMYDMFHWDLFYEHINESLEIAKELNDTNLSLLTLHQSCGSRILQHNGNLAKVEIEAALPRIKNASSIIQSVVYAQAAKAYSLGTPDLGERITAQRYLEKSQYVATHLSPDDRYIPERVNAAKYLFTQLDALISVGNIAPALSLLDDIEENTEPGNTRNMALLQLKRASCYASLKHPEYKQALELLGDAFRVYKDIGSKYNIKEIEKVYKTIATGPYGNSPDVVDLGIEIKELRVRK
jgi:transcriptional regulator with XRE-family HTH domain